jgi:hypothetical protein
VNKKEKINMSTQDNRPIEFELDENSRFAIEKLALKKKIETLTEEECQKIVGGTSFVACNQSFVACNAPFKVNDNSSYLGTLLS